MQQIQTKTCTNKFWSKLCNMIKTKKQVNVINLEGIIGGSQFKQGLNIASLNKVLESAFKGKNIAAVILNINSPGGSPVQSELISKRIRQLSKQKNIPIISFVEDIAASGGYWLACTADEIIVAENALLGSLGVRFSGFGLDKAIEKIGIERRIHTQGGSKALLDPFLPEKPADINIILGAQAEIYQNFKTHVKTSRKERLSSNEEEIFSGAIWSSKKAIELGLVDKIGDLFSEVEQRFGIDTEIKLVNQDRSWLKRKLGMLFGLFFEEILTITDKFTQSRIELR